MWVPEHEGAVVSTGEQVGLVDLEPRGILFPQSGVEPGSPALQDVFLTTGPPGKSLNLFFFPP